MDNYCQLCLIMSPFCFKGIRAGYDICYCQKYLDWKCLQIRFDIKIWKCLMCLWTDSFYIKSALFIPWGDEIGKCKMKILYMYSHTGWHIFIEDNSEFCIYVSVFLQPRFLPVSLHLQQNMLMKYIVPYTFIPYGLSSLLVVHNNTFHNELVIHKRVFTTFGESVDQTRIGNYHDYTILHILQESYHEKYIKWKALFMNSKVPKERYKVLKPWYWL